MRWSKEVLGQLTSHWQGRLRPRLEGLGDSEYHWEPVAGCWGLRPRGDGSWGLESAADLPTPPPVTTIAWRIGHIIALMGARSAVHFGAPAIDARTHAYAARAEEGLAQLDVAYATWTAGVAALSASDLAAPVGPSEGAWAAHPMAGLVLHVNREVVHHGAEICLLRDLWAHQGGAPSPR
ncbi:DinB family protein [Pseudokineococcus sp. 5B2Z-1]|uniref:DinB family protein n=1 Tax=Pseudokineococcus sp. 5B2Z-1 TaxID=3132744 RepID=UPI00403FA30C